MIITRNMEYRGLLCTFFSSTLFLKMACHCTLRAGELCLTSVSQVWTLDTMCGRQAPPPPAHWLAHLYRMALCRLGTLDTLFAALYKITSVGTAGERTSSSQTDVQGPRGDEWVWQRVLPTWSGTTVCLWSEARRTGSRDTVWRAPRVQSLAGSLRPEKRTQSLYWQGSDSAEGAAGHCPGLG